MIKGYRKDFCDINCAQYHARWGTKNNRERKMMAPCAWCGGHVDRPKPISITRKYCSNKCRYNVSNERKKNATNYAEKKRRNNATYMKRNREEKNRIIRARAKLRGSEKRQRKAIKKFYED